MQIAADERPLDTPAAAAFLGLSEDNLIQRRVRRRPPEYLKIGKSVRYLLSDLREFRDACRVRVRGE